MVSRQDIIDRLLQFGYTATNKDYDQIDFELTSVTNYVMNYCNIKEIPDIVDPRIVDKVCSNFLYNKKNSGELTGFNYDAVIKSIKEGDTTLTHAVGQGEDTPENRFDSFVRTLQNGFDKWITPHRKLRW